MTASSVPHLLVDARPLNGSRNGISRFVEQLMAAWPVSPAFRTTLISNRPIRSNAAIPVGIERLYDAHPFGRLPGTLWMTLRAPALARRIAATHFLGTQHVLPLWRTTDLKQGVVVHDLVFELFPQTMAHTNRILTGYLAPRSIRRADRIFCVSKTTRADLERHLGMKLDHAMVCYPGRTPTLSAASSQPSSKTAGGISLLIVGSMEPRKNVPPFLEAFLIASDRDEGLTLDLVSGDAWGDVLSDALRNRISQHPRVRIHRRISDEALGALYDAADYLVFPSLYEGFGLPILEAVGRCAVIANDIPIFREIAGMVDGIHLMNLQTSPSQIAERLLTLMAEGGRTGVADDHGQFSWQLTVRQIVESMGLIPVKPASDADSIRVSCATSIGRPNLVRPDNFESADDSNAGGDNFIVAANCALRIPDRN